ncbi:MAG: DUF1508 domain-containing protein, partial [Spirochaetia bacterium]|nr:DUF1508 domain-containing protein [Spirochaetia bacterium]
NGIESVKTNSADAEIVEK